MACYLSWRLPFMVEPNACARLKLQLGLLAGSACNSAFHDILSVHALFFIVFPLQRVLHSFALLWKGVNTAITLDHPTVHCLVEMASLAVLLQSPCVGGLHTNQNKKKIKPCLRWCVLLWVPQVWRNLSWITMDNQRTTRTITPLSLMSSTDQTVATCPCWLPCKMAHSLEAAGRQRRVELSESEFRSDVCNIPT